MFASVLVFLYIFGSTSWTITDGSVTKEPPHIPTPPNFPSNIPLRLGTYENWSNELTVESLWFATPANVNDVVVLANWAHANGYTLRASGHMHNWAPFTVTTANKNVKNVVLIDTTKNLDYMEVTSSPYPNTTAVRVETGTSMLNLLTFLEKHGLGVNTSPAPGDVTVGGVLATGGHGTSVPAVGETLTPGYSYGTLSDLIISLTAVVWNTTKNAYHLEAFNRSHIDAKVFLVHLGRAFITEVVLMVGPNHNLRCVSRTDISSDELFADPVNVNKNTRTFASFLDKTGRIETIMFAFTKFPWLKIWSISPKKPLLSRKVSSPFNYLFSNIIPESLSALIRNLTNNAWILTPLLGVEESTIVTAGLLSTLSVDLWGPSKNLLLYVLPTTLRQTANGYVVITTRSNIQKVVSQIVAYYNKILKDYASKLIYPLNGVIEIRSSYLDQPRGVVPDGVSPILSAVLPLHEHPEFDTAVWLSILTFPKAPHENQAFSKIESFLFETFNGTDAFVRVEWSKGWAYTEQSGWSNKTVYRNFIPSSYPGWNFAVNTLNKYDPHRIFSNAFLDDLLVEV